jgi:hypothetical protein
MRVTQEHAQHPAPTPQCRLGQPGPEALGHERAEDGRRQLAQPGDADPVQVGLEAGQVMPLVHDRLRAQAPLGDQVAGEPRRRAAEGQLTARRPVPAKPGRTTASICSTGPRTSVATPGL